MIGDPGAIARARSALDAAQSDLHTVQLKLAPLRAQERRALQRVAEASQRLRMLKDAGQGQLLENAPGARSPVSPALPDVANESAEPEIVRLARLYEGGGDAPCDVEA